MRVCLQPMDFMQISTIASLHSIGLLCPTKPSKRAVHGAVLLAPASLQERFCVVRLAAHVSNGLKSRIRPVVGRI